MQLIDQTLTLLPFSLPEKILILRDFSCAGAAVSGLLSSECTAELHPKKLLATNRQVEEHYQHQGELG